MIVGGIEEIRTDDAVNEIYVADNSFGGRVMVFSLDKFEFKRGWGAYGHKLSEISTKPEDHAYTPSGPMAKEFVGHLTFNFSNDGLVYAADRTGNRIHVTDKQGNFKQEFKLAEYTGVGGSTGGVMFSNDKEQKLLYISDLTNNHIWFLDRKTGKVVGTLGQQGENGGSSSACIWKPPTPRAISTRARCSPASACSGSCRPTARAASCSSSCRACSRKGVMGRGRACGRALVEQLFS